MRLIPGPHTFALDLVLPDGATLAADAGTFEAALVEGGSVVTTPRVQPVEPLATFTVEVAAGTSAVEVSGTVRYVLDDRTHEAPFARQISISGTPEGEAAPFPITVRA